MTHINPYYSCLQTSYLFYRINQTVDALRRNHPQERLLLLGVGDVTLPMAPAVIAALHRAVEDQAKQEAELSNSDMESIFSESGKMNSVTTPPVPFPQKRTMPHYLMAAVVVLLPMLRP